MNIQFQMGISNRGKHFEKHCHPDFFGLTAMYNQYLLYLNKTPYLLCEGFIPVMIDELTFPLEKSSIEV